MVIRSRPGSSLRLMGLLTALLSSPLVAPVARADELAAGWRHAVVIYGVGAAIDLDHEEGQGRNHQHYDLTAQRPLVGVTISF